MATIVEAIAKDTVAVYLTVIAILFVIVITCVPL